jgi:CHAD domain-containing protein
MTYTDQLLSSFDKSWQQFSSAWKKANATASTKSIHDLRVSARRLTATLEITRVLSRNADIVKLQRQLKKVLKGMGPLRDVHVQLENLSQVRSTPLIKDFKEVLERREKREIGDIQKDLKGSRKRQLSTGVDHVRSELERIHTRRDESRTRAAIERLLKSRRNEFLKCRRRFDPSNAETLHEMRIALKKFRYAVEAAQPALGPASKRLEEMRAFQQLMGDTRDAEILQIELEKWAGKRGRKMALVPALEQLREKRELLMKKIIESAAAFDEVLPQPPATPVLEKTRAAVGSGSAVTPSVRDEHPVPRLEK